jgi:hypothetical protein
MVCRFALGRGMIALYSAIVLSKGGSGQALKRVLLIVRVGELGARAHALILVAS